MISRIALAAALAAAVSLPASADGLASYKDGPYAGPTWTGFYIGAHGGYAWGSADFPGAPQYPDGPPRPSLEGGFVGGQIGYNIQFSSFVVGAVADISFANLEKTVRDGNYLTETTNVGKFGTVRGIAGYSYGRWLPYGTFGFAWSDVSYDLTCADAAAAQFGLCKNPGPRHIGDSQIMTGLAYGGGLKYAVNGNFSVGAEYLRIDLDEKEFSFGPLAALPPGTKKIDGTADTVKFTVDYKFGGVGYEPLK